MDVSLRFLSVDRFSVLTVRLLLAHLFGLGWKDIDVTTSFGKRWPTTIMIVVWNPKDNITVKESAKNKKSVSPLEFEIFVRSLRIVVCVVRFFRNAVQRGRIWKPLENTCVNSQFGIRRGLEWARPKNVLEAMVEQQKVKKNWCPTILKYNLLIYVLLVLKEKDTSEVKFCWSNFIFYVWKCNSLTTNSK